MESRFFRFAIQLTAFCGPVLVACIEVGHDAETGCLVDTSAPGCRATSGRGGGSSGGSGRGGSSVGGSSGSGARAGSSSLGGATPTGGTTGEAGAAPEGGEGGA